MRKNQKVLFVNPFPIAENDYKDYAKIYTLNSSSPAFAFGLKKLSANTGLDFSGLIKPGEGISFIDVLKWDNQTIYELELSSENGIRVD